MKIQKKMDKIIQRVMKGKYKMTPQREATVRVLLENEKEHLSAEETYFLVKSICPEVGLSTIYRNLELLTELQVLEKVNFGDGVTRFDLRGEEAGHMHHHLICTRCSNVKEIKEDWLSALEERLEQEYGFSVTDHKLEFSGVYQNCDKGDCMRKR